MKPEPTGILRRGLRGDWPHELQAALAPILPLLEDDAITEIEANAFDEIWAKGLTWKGHKRLAVTGWTNKDDLLIACARISDVIGRRVNRHNPLLNGRLPGGERVNIAVPPACDRVSLTIRKFPTETMTFEILERYGSVNRAITQMCASLVKARQSILVAGGTSAGKTSLLNALSRFIPPHERVITVEDARELQIQQPNWVALETVEPWELNADAVGIGDLVRNALRQTPDRIIVGEVRGEEAFALLRAFSTGHGGGFGTIHANDAEDALHQVQLLALMAPVTGLTSQVVAGMVGRAVDVVIYQRFFEEENARRVVEIIELDKPGAVVSSSGAVQFSFRTLLQWDAGTASWIFPADPSPRLRRTLAARHLPWPRPLLSDLDERTIVSGTAR